MSVLRVFALSSIWMFTHISCRQSDNERNALAFKPNAGVLYKVAIGYKTEQHWTYQDKPWQVSDSLYTSYDFRLLQKKDSLQLIQLRFTNIFARTNSYVVNTGTKNVSADEVHHNVFLLYDYLLHFVKGKTVTVWMDKKGRPVGVNGIAAIIDSVADASGEPVQLVKPYLGDFIGEEKIKDDLRQLFCFLPGRPKREGEAWAENVLLTSKAPVKWSSNCTLQTLHGDTADINCDAFVSARQGGDGQTYMKGKLAATFLVDYNTGMPLSWVGRSETITSTDNYNITSHKVIHMSVSQ